jgi:hypothetical protein
MAKNIAVGFTIAGLILMGVLAFAQKHHECWNGHLLAAFRHGHGHFTAFSPCGSLSPSM